jgi:hypothetical protein
MAEKMAKTGEEGTLAQAFVQFALESGVGGEAALALALERPRQIARA